MAVTLTLNAVGTPFKAPGAQKQLAWRFHPGARGAALHRLPLRGTVIMVQAPGPHLLDGPMPQASKELPLPKKMEHGDFHPYRAVTCRGHRKVQHGKRPSEHRPWLLFQGGHAALGNIGAQEPQGILICIVGPTCREVPASRVPCLFLPLG